MKTKYEDHGLPVRDLAFSKDDYFLVTVSDDSHINLIDVAAEKRLFSFTGHQQEIVSWWFHPKHNILVTGSVDKTIKIWDIDSRKWIDTETFHTDTVWDLKFSPCGRYLVSGSEDGVLSILEFE